jgi:hypothetical protein
VLDHASQVGVRQRPRLLDQIAEPLQLALVKGAVPPQCR